MTDPREAAARAAYGDWIAPVRDLEPAWDDLPESHRDRLISAQDTAIDAFLTASLSQEDRELVERLRATRHVNLAWAKDALAAIDAEQKAGLAAADRIAVLSAELAEAKRERDEAVRLASTNAEFWTEACDIATERGHKLLTVRAERDRLREALRPFARSVPYDFAADDEPVNVSVTGGDFRRAARALTGGENG